MSAINHLKNFATSITGKLFTSSKKNHRQDDIIPGNSTTGRSGENGTVRIISEKKNRSQSSQTLSDFTIF